MNERKELTCSFETINAVRCQSTMDIMRSSYYCEKTELPLTLPAICPSCQRIFANNIQPIVAVNNGCTSNIDDCFDECSVVAVYRCSSCNELFTIWTDHKRDEEDNFSGTIIKQYPFNGSQTEFSDDIESISPKFVNIYHQAEQAEHHGLQDICGMGYRRALEFLVDAYVRWLNPEKDINPQQSLSKKISNYIQDERIKELSTKATWLGNDHTHIIDSHEGYSVDDMKRFIMAIVSAINYDFTYKAAKNVQSTKG